MPGYALRFRLLPLAAMLCVGSCLSTEGYYRYQDAGTSGTAGTTGSAGTSGSAGTAGGVAGTTGSAGSTGGGPVGAAGTTAAGGRGGTTGSAGSPGGRGGTTGSAGRGGTTGAAGSVGSGGSGAVLLSENFDPPQTTWPLDYGVLMMQQHSLVADGAQAQVLSLNEAMGDQAIVAAGPATWTNISIEAKVKVLSFGGGSSSDGAAICARLTGPESFFYFAIQSDGKGKIKINNKAVGGSNTSLSSGLDIGFTINTWMRLRMDVVGYTINVFVHDGTNYVMKGTYTVTASNQMLPMGGIALMVQNAVAEFDDIVVRALP